MAVDKHFGEILFLLLIGLAKAAQHWSTARARQQKTQMAGRPLAQRPIADGDGTETSEPEDDSSDEVDENPESQRDVRGGLALPAAALRTSESERRPVAPTAAQSRRDQPSAKRTLTVVSAPDDAGSVFTLILENEESVRRAFILSEVLGRPRSEGS